MSCIVTHLPQNLRINSTLKREQQGRGEGGRKKERKEGRGRGKEGRMDAGRGRGRKKGGRDGRQKGIENQPSNASIHADPKLREL